MINKHYVYVHKRRSDGTVFYVGKGQGNRYKVTYGRNKHWQKTAKDDGFYAEIVKRFASHECALSYEKIIIDIVGRENLSNLTAGGQGTINPSRETRNLMSARKKGIKQSDEHAEKSRTAKIGKKQPLSARLATSKIKSKPIINSDGEIFSSVKNAVTELSKKLGFKVSQGNISTCARGDRNNAYGFTWSYDTSKVPAFIPTPSNEKQIYLICKGIKFNSVGDAVEYIKKERGSAVNQCISLAARTGRRAYGYKWKYVDNDNKTKEAPGRLHK